MLRVLYRGWIRGERKGLGKLRGGRAIAGCPGKASPQQILFWRSFGRRRHAEL